MPLHTWEKQEITLTAEREFANPYTDVEVWIDLEGPGFRKRCYGFWDGGRTFRIRVLATAPGRWTWRSGSRPRDDGLDGRTGAFEAVEWSAREKEENPNRRGFVTRTPNGHALQYADGTPFYLVGDTWWAAATFRFPWYDDDRERPIGPEMGFKDMVRHRRRQGFNCVTILAGFPGWAHDGKPARIVMEDGHDTVIRSAWQHPADGSARDMHNEGGRPFLFPGRVPGYEDVFPDVDRINPDYFRCLDRKMDYLNAQGFVPFLEVMRRDTSQAWKRYYDWPDSYARYIHYVFSRYQANACILSPVHYDYRGQAISPRDFLKPANQVHRTYGPPPFGNLVSSNAALSTLCQFGHVDEAPWLTLHQVGNKREHEYYWYLTQIYRTEPPLPALHGEPYYSGWGMADTWHYDRGAAGNTPEDDRYVRSGMYGSFLSGGLAGYIYGCAGMVRAAREDAYRVKMWEGLEWSSAEMVPIFRDFVFCRESRYQDLVPDAELVSPNRSHDLYSWDGWAYCAATEERDFLMLYFEKGIDAGHVRSVRRDAAYTASYFDVRTGKWVERGTLEADDFGVLDLPAKPTDEDWALALALDD